MVSVPTRSRFAPGDIIDATVIRWRCGRRTAGDVWVCCMRVGCIETVTISSHPPLVDSRLPARSDLVAYLRIEERIDEDSPSDPDCRVRHRATFLRTLSRPSHSKPVSGTADVFLNTSPASPSVQSGKEYIIWLTWRAPRTPLIVGITWKGWFDRSSRGK